MPDHERLPRIDPIRPVAAKLFEGKDWTFEFKYDGFRGLLYIEPGRNRFISRQQKMLRRFDELAGRLAEALGVENAILDGEIVVRDEADRPIFDDLLRQRGTPIYVAFDLLWLDGRDLRGEPLKERRAMLRSILPRQSTLIEQTFSVDGSGNAMFAFMCEHDLEGIVAKRLTDPYRPRTKWYKIKNPNYSQAKGRPEFFNGIRARAAH